LQIEPAFPLKCLPGINRTDVIELAAIGFKVQ